jgi:hypothetical protein
MAYGARCGFCALKNYPILGIVGGENLRVISNRLGRLCSAGPTKR